MKRVEIGVIEREVSTKGKLRKYRNDGFIPGIIYGEKVGVLPIAIKERDFITIEHKYGRSVLVDMKIGKKTIHGIFKEIQRNPIGRRAIHIDFEAVDLRKPVSTSIPIVTVGEAKGVKAGGILDQTLHELEVEGLLTEIPDRIEVDVSNLEIKDVLYVKDIVVPEGVKVYSDPEDVIVSIVTPKAEEVAPPAPAEEAGVEAGKEEAPKGAAAKGEAPKGEATEETKKEEKK